MHSEFDFYKEFLGVSYARVEQVSELVGKIVSILFISMVENGLTEKQAYTILSDAETVLVNTMITMAKEQKANETN